MKKKYKKIPLSYVLDQIEKEDPIRRAGIEARAKELVLSMKFREARRKAKLSQHDLAKKSGVAQNIISKVESGKQNVTVETLTKISFALGKEITIGLK